MESERYHMATAIFPSLCKKKAEAEAVQRMPESSKLRQLYGCLWDPLTVDDSSNVLRPITILGTGETVGYIVFIYMQPFAKQFEIDGCAQLNLIISRLESSDRYLRQAAEFYGLSRGDEIDGASDFKNNSIFRIRNCFKTLNIKWRVK